MRRTYTAWYVVALASVLGASASPAGAAPASSAPADTGITLRGGQEGTVFHSLTIEGEDRIRLEFDRPELTLDLDPSKAPGLEWGTAREVLDRTVPDLRAPLLAMSAGQLSPYLARPWLQGFSTAPVARFDPETRNVERWKLTVADSRGRTVATYEGRGVPKGAILWDGRARDGSLVMPGLVYSYAFEAFDRAGNKRSFVGQGFGVPAFRSMSAAGVEMTFTGADLLPPATSSSALEAARPGDPALLLEAASWLNQYARPGQRIQVTATARTFEQADRLSARVAGTLATRMIGDPSGIQTADKVEPDAPESGTVLISTGTTTPATSAAPAKAASSTPARKP